MAMFQWQRAHSNERGNKTCGSRQGWLGSVVVLLTCAALMACVPSASSNQQQPAFTFTKLEIGQTQNLLASFQTQFNQLGITLDVQNAKAFAYEGQDEKAFLKAVDDLYLEHPGFCPVEGGFIAGENKRFVTLIADASGLRVVAFAYDLSRRPAFVGVFVPGVSARALSVKPCKSS